MASTQDKRSARPVGAATSRGDDRQAQLLEIAGRLFAKNGFKGTSLRDIAEEAQITAAVLAGGVDGLFHRLDLERLAAIEVNVLLEVAYEV